MTSKNANWLFLTMILTHIGVVLFLSFFGAFISIGIIANFFLGQAVLMVPALLFLLFTRQNPAPGGYMPASRPAPGGYAAVQQPVLSGYATAQQPVLSGYAAAQQPAPDGYVPASRPARAVAFRRVKISSLLMIALCTFLIMPLVTVLNALSMFFTDNAVAAIEGDIVSVPFPVMLFMIGIFGPFCEEFVFRGMIYGSYAGHRGAPENAGISGQGGGLRAILLSAFTFGLMHMNLNQAIYAFAIGILLAILVEAAGSLWASVFCHMFFNSIQVVLMYLSQAVLGKEYENVMNETAKELTNADIQAVLAVYLVIAAVTVPIAACCVAWIVKNEGRQEAVRALFCRRDSRRTAQPPSPPQVSMGGRQEPEPLLSVPLVVAIVLCLGFMSLELL